MEIKNRFYSTLVGLDESTKAQWEDTWPEIEKMAAHVLPYIKKTRWLQSNDERVEWFLSYMYLIDDKFIKEIPSKSLTSAFRSCLFLCFLSEDFKKTFTAFVTACRAKQLGPSRLGATSAYMAEMLTSSHST